jgi:radical SAM superfamily enzyme with C-terminal helix-hairpin-helix motif
VRIAAFGEESAVAFDVNTAQPGVLRMVPGITEKEVATWTAGRPYRSREDFERRAGVRGETVKGLKF